jgi:hypothetical protein
LWAPQELIDSPEFCASTATQEAAENFFLVVIYEEVMQRLSDRI